ncbi:MAG: hypothetical protein IJO03_10870 [Clostridia bacterium]|nr:hypothetical protein [Clostridia bacterium]MBQ7122751.1 hypothetical protein [Clostridia bacterium]
MKHLTIDEIINFVTIDSISKENLELAAAVNGHILVCDKCREKVKAFQTVSDSLTGMLTPKTDLDFFEDIDM